jgi:hypothetical protein
MTDVALPPVPSEPPRRRRRLRAASAVLLGILACIALIASTTVFWVHQVALSTDRWVALSANVASDPAVIQSVSEQVSQQTIVALDVEGRLAGALPGNAQLLAGPITASVQTRLQQTLADLLASPGFQQAWEDANRFAHQQLLAILRNDSTIVTLENGVVTLNLFPLVDAALRSLQAQGIIPASVAIPDLTAATAPEQARNALQSALGVTLPEAFGTIPLVRADRLETLRTAIRVFDLLLILAIVVTVLLFVAAALVARDRRRATILLGAGAVIALLVARGVIRGIENSIVGSVSDPVGATTARGVFDAVLTDLFGLMVIVSAVGGIVAILAWLFGRRDDIGRAAASAGAAARRATAAGTEAGRAAASSAAPRDASIRDWVRAHLALLRAAGVVVALAWLATLAVGWEPVAVIGAILVLYEVGLGSLAERPSEAPSGSPAA